MWATEGHQDLGVGPQLVEVPIQQRLWSVENLQAMSMRVALAWVV